MTLRVLSLGAGVQSTTLALMAARGEVTPMPDCAIFADTKWEPKAVYKHLYKLRVHLPFPVHVVSAGDIRADALARTNSSGQRFASVPWFTVDAKGNKGMGRRQCTKEYKLNPIRRKLRELLGYLPRERIPVGAAEVWIGISTDEAARMKPSRDRWVENIWPLIDKRMSRQDCETWLADAGWSAPKSACIGCPFHSDAQWRRLRDETPDEWDDAVAVDAALRANGAVRGLRSLEYMHRSCVPLDLVDLRTWAEQGQPDMFQNECEGMCGV